MQMNFRGYLSGYNDWMLIVGTLATAKWAKWYYAFTMYLFKKGRSLWCFKQGIVFVEMTFGRRTCTKERESLMEIGGFSKQFELIPNGGFSGWSIPIGQISNSKKENGKFSNPIQTNNFCPKSYGPK